MTERRETGDETRSPVALCGVVDARPPVPLVDPLSLSLPAVTGVWTQNVDVGGSDVEVGASPGSLEVTDAPARTEGGVGVATGVVPPDAGPVPSAPPHPHPPPPTPSGHPRT